MNNLNNNQLLIKILLTLVALIVVFLCGGSARADTLYFLNGAKLEGKLLDSDETHIQFLSEEKTGNYLKTDVLFISLGEGKSFPPEVETDQITTSPPLPQRTEADRGYAPSSAHVWVSGYWRWQRAGYIWIPGYWAIPPNQNYVYIPGRWYSRNNFWVYDRGGWGWPGTRIIVQYEGPRPFQKGTVFLFPFWGVGPVPFPPRHHHKNKISHPNLNKRPALIHRRSERNNSSIQRPVSRPRRPTIQKRQTNNNPSRRR